MLEHGRAGQLVPPSDPPAMAAAFRTLMADPEVLANWRARAKQGSEYFTVARMARDYDLVYHLGPAAGRRGAQKLRSV